MTNTKEKILVAALRLFAVNGYEAVSVSQIAGELGITKGALYKHYKNKRDIFNCIFEYVCRLDVERSRKSGVPEQDYSDMPEAFSHVSAKSLGDYMKEQFRYWSEDEIACNFRKTERRKEIRMNNFINIKNTGFLKCFQRKSHKIVY